MNLKTFTVIVEAVPIGRPFCFYTMRKLDTSLN